MDRIEELREALLVASRRGVYPLPSDEEYLFAGRPVVVDSALLDKAANALTPSTSEEWTALKYATQLAVSTAKKHYPNPDWQPQPDLMGVLTQIDNMLTGLVRAAPDRDLKEQEI